MINDIFHLLWTSDFKIRYNITFLRCYVILLSLDFLFHFFVINISTDVNFKLYFCS